MRAVRLLGFWTGVVLSTLAFAPPAIELAQARARPQLTPAAQIRLATNLVAKIPRARFARGHRAGVLRLGRRAASLAGKRNQCKALAAADGLLSAVAIPTTWFRRRIPIGLLRRPLQLLRAAESKLLRRAGARCARPVKTDSLKPHVGGSGGAIVKTPPNPSEQGDGLNPPLPSGPYRPPRSIGAGSGVGPDPQMLSDFGRGRGGDAIIASDPLTFFQVSDVGVPPRQICCPEEQTAAVAGNVVWYTGNASVALSTNHGRTFTRFDPSTVLPDQGFGFCCDQLVSYSPTYNIFVWVMQYWCAPQSCVDSNRNCRTSGVQNRIRIAVASPGDLVAHASNPGLAWTYWDITPRSIGQPLNAWFDRSDDSVNPWNFNWNVDIICGTAGSLLGRISLAQLAARHTVSLGYITPGGRMTSAQGLGTSTTYFAGNTSLSQSRIWSWAPFSGTLFAHDVNHSTVPTFDNALLGSDNGNYYDRYGIFPGEVESSTVSGNTIYLAQGTGRATCTANCTGNNPTLHHVFDQDAVLITKYDLNTWHEVGERWLWNHTLGFSYPALATDGVGDVGVVFRGAAARHNAQLIAGFLTPSEQFTFALPEGLPFEIGDYYSLRPGRTPQTSVTTAETVQNDSGQVNVHWNYVEYGHGQAPYVAPPSVHINTPANQSLHTKGASVLYSASVSDPVDGTLPNAAIVWREDGTQIGTGPSISHVENVVGLHTVTVTATNGDGRSASASVQIRVQAPPGPIQAQIASPKDQTNFGYSPYNKAYGQYCQDIQFRSTVSGGKGPFTFNWDDQVSNGNAPVTTNKGVATTQSPVITLCAGSSENTFYTHSLTLTVSDGNNTAQAFVTVYVGSYRLA